MFIRLPTLNLEIYTYTNHNLRDQHPFGVDDHGNLWLGNKVIMIDHAVKGEPMEFQFSFRGLTFTNKISPSGHPHVEGTPDVES